MNNLKQSIVKSLVNYARNNVSDYIHICVLLGMILGVSFLGLIGYSIGSIFNQSQIGMYIGFGYYTYNFVLNLPILKSQTNQLIEQLERVSNS